MSAPHRQTNSGGRYSHPSPPWYSPPLGAPSGPDPLGGHCCSSHIGRQTGENPCWLPLTFSPTDRSRPNRLFLWWIAGPVGRRSQHQTRGLELAADHETGETPSWLRRRELLSDLWTGNPNHQPIQPLRHSRRLGHRCDERRTVPSVCDFVLCTKLRPPPGAHWHSVSFILS